MNKVKDIFYTNMFKNNPVLIQILGICSALAVTNSVKNTLTMTIAVSLVTACSSFTISVLKAFIPKQVRMIMQTLVIAFFVILVDLTLQAKFPEISKNLGPYVGLIITNCIIMGRAEAFAQANPPILSFWDGLAAGFGYMIVLLAISIVRELFGFGTILGFSVLPSNFQTWTIMIMPPSGFFMLAIAIWIVNAFKNRKLKKQQEEKEGKK